MTQAKTTPYSGFKAAGVLTATTTETEEKNQPAKKRNRRRKKKTTTDQESYEPVAIPDRKEQMRVYAIGAADADRTFPPELCRDPMPMLACVIGVLGASEESDAMPDETKQKVTESIRYLAERLATVQAIVDPSTPAVNAANVLPTGA